MRLSPAVVGRPARHDALAAASPYRAAAASEKDERPDHDVFAAGCVGGRGWVDAGAVERPARDRTVGDRVVALKHRDLVGLLLGKPVPLVTWQISEAGGLADAVVVDAVVGDVGLVGERRPGAP